MSLLIPPSQLWLCRHGETEWSLSGAHTSRTDIPLTDNGREKAVELGAYLKDTPFAAVFVSPMHRAKETCRIAGLIDNAYIDEGLMEWNYGIYEGKTTKEIREEVPGWSVWKDPIYEGETAEQVGERADDVIARALEAGGQQGGGNVALFAHAHILRILAARWIGLPAKGGALFGLGTGSVSVLGWERETRVILHWNRGFGG
ncbi:probable phosphoglycerate mutase [Granulicella pectinivorans]|uniref:Probable phosphoglycerate mutase n=1 Tax=Granulicella pectinivorans TaxID=474950 RepID=A0A1I6MP99_9BACT|nr:histidine phosphatase family protein [Granulicella pectinivorans]SFS17398.1 probable phosphoglycerate mutase [Granulicella pectinivorans]